MNHNTILGAVLSVVLFVAGLFLGRYWEGHTWARDFERSNCHVHGGKTFVISPNILSPFSPHINPRINPRPEPHR